MNALESVWKLANVILNERSERRISDSEARSAYPETCANPSNGCRGKRKAELGRLFL